MPGGVAHKWLPDFPVAENMRYEGSIIAGGVAHKCIEKAIEVTLKMLLKLPVYIRTLGKIILTIFQKWISSNPPDIPANSFFGA